MRSRIVIPVLLLLTVFQNAFATTQLIQNSGFDSGVAYPWILQNQGATIGNISGYAFSGSDYLAMGNFQDGVFGDAYQIVTFPTNLIAANLSFYLNTVNEDTNGTGTDNLQVSIRSTNLPPAQLVDVGYLTDSSATPAGQYNFVSVNIAPYAGGGILSPLAGQTVEVYFAVNTDPAVGYLNSFDIDNVSLIAATTADIPPNDNFTNAILIPFAGATNTVNNTYASRETGEPKIDNNVGGHSVWYTWTAPAIGTVNISSAGSSFDTLLGVFTGTSLTNLTLVTSQNGFAAGDNQAVVKFSAVQGTQYQIVLDGGGGQTGNAVLSFRFTPDTTPPTVSFSTPPAGSTVTNSSVFITGVANDNIAVSNVQYRLQNAGGVSAWQLAMTTNLWTNWSATVTNLIPGPNTVTLEAFDTSTNMSTLASRVFDYDVGAVLILNTNGRGTITGATNGQSINIGFPYTITAKPAVGFAFAGWTGSSTASTATLKFTGTTNLEFTANFVDDQKPMLSITAPTASLHWSNSVLPLAGKASDNVGVANVFYQLNGGVWTNAITTNGWTNWSASVTLTQTNNNTIKAYAVDAAGNFSATSSVTFAYIQSARLQLAISGSGLISPNDSNALLQLGHVITLTATARSGSVFSNWVDTNGLVVTNGPVLKFVMQSNLFYTANFVPNPFLAAAGTYEGLFFDTNGVVPSGSGFFSAQVQNTGSFTAKFQQGTAAHSVSGQFSLTGAWATNKIAGWTGTTVSLNLDLTGNNALTGGLTNAGWNSELTANRSVFSTAHPAPQAGKYTLVIPGANEAGRPGGAGFGSVTVQPNGAIVMSGTLGDGTKVTPSAAISPQGAWPLYIPTTSTGQGLVIGWLNFTNEPDRDLDGVVAWYKPALPKAPAYPAGFSNAFEVLGSAYTLPAGARVLNLTNGYVLLENGGLSQSISNQFVLGANDKATGSNKLTLTFTTTTGLFSGSATNAAGKPVTFSGAVLQKQTNASGQFLNAQQSGSVSIQPLP